MIWEWFQRIRSLDVPISGPMLQEAALSFAEKIGKTHFQASNGWLESFKIRHSISFKILCGESLSADIDSALDFSSRISLLCSNYKDENIFNCDETALFYRSPPSKSLVEKYKDMAKSGKYSKERVSVLLAASISGEKLMPLVIGKALKPRCFKNIKDLPVIWRSSSSSWMTSKIFSDWLDIINKQFRSQNRNVLLFLHNCTSHKNQEYSNIKLAFSHQIQQVSYNLWIKGLFDLLRLSTENFFCNLYL